MIFQGRLRHGVWALAVLAAFAAGCGDDGDNGDDNNNGGGSDVTVPLDEGDNWDYTVDQTADGDTDTYPRADVVTDTRVIAGQTYAVVQTISQTPALRAATSEAIASRFGLFAPAADTSEAFLRQSGQKVYQYTEFEISEDFPEYIRFVLESLNAANPWQVADFASSSGSSWTIVNANDTFETRGGTTEVTVRLTGSNEGRTSVTVPAGTFSDCYRGRLTQLFELEQNQPPLPPISVTQTVTSDIYFKDGVGVVKEMSSFTLEQTGQDPITETTESELTSYDVE
jgi:hypothetical protein